MSILSRFLGRREVPADVGALVANPERSHDPLALGVVFAGPLAIDTERLGQVLRTYDPSLRDARCEAEAGLPAFMGLAGWNRHVVRLIGFDAPMPTEAIERCVAPSHYSQALKEQVRAHRSHLILYYAGYVESTREQYVALAAVAGALGGLAVLNESARTSLPAAVFADDAVKGECVHYLRTFPLLMLYCGFVKYDVEGVAGVWLRTYGADRFGRPDFAAHAAGHHESQKYYDIFENVLTYLEESGARMAPGHTMQVGEESFLRLRAPGPGEDFLHGPGEVLVAELIGADEINRTT